MRKRHLGLMAAVVALSVGAPNTSRAQAVYVPTQPSPIGRPMFGPYYNPFRPFVPGGVNYGLGQPGFGAASSFFGMQPLSVGQAPLLPQDQVGGVSVTGHPASFFNYSHFYYNRLVGGGVTFGPSATGAASTGILTAAPRPGVTASSTGGNVAGQPGKPPTPMK